jgi:hypothetical protein
MQAFLVSIVAGILFPVVPILAELGLGEHLKPETLSVTAVVYTAAIGLVSRNQAILVSSLFCSLMCALIYAVDGLGVRDSRPTIFFVIYGPIITSGAIYFYSVCYAVERFGRHVVENEPFLEI